MDQRTTTTKLFIRLIGVVHLFNFYNLYDHASKLFGEHGLIPIVKYVEQFTGPDLNLLDKLLQCPTMFLWFQGDAVIVGGAIVGLCLSALLVLGIQSRWCFLLIFPLYSSYVAVGQMLYSFQWDSLILEITFLCILLPNSGWAFRKFRSGADGLTTWLFLWLLFRLYMESGVAKLFWGPDSWSSLVAMSHYYETAPIPTVLGWKAHFLPESWHTFETGATLVVEILGPAFIFSGKWGRRTAFLVFTVFQMGILLTANYGIFNYSTLALQLFLLTDHDLRRVPWLGRRFRDLRPEGMPRPKWWVYPLGLIIFFFSIIEFMMFAGGRGVSETALAKVHKYTSATRISSRYHLFGPIDPIRYEMELECRYDTAGWQVVDFPYNAGPLDRTPPMVAPYHPRVDFRLWFERYPIRWEDKTMPYPAAVAAPAVLPKYMERLVYQLLDSADLAYRHLERPPCWQQPLDSIRITYYHYNMVDSLDADSNQLYWDRNPVGLVYIDTTMASAGSRVKFFDPPKKELTALEKAHKAVRRLPSEDNYLNLSVELYKAGRYRDCIQVCQGLIKINPDHAVAYNNICTSYNQLGEHENALWACDQALRINPKYELAINNRKTAVHLLR